MAYNRAQKIDYFTEEVSAERLSLSDIRKQLEREHIEEEEIKIVFSAVDNNLQRAAQKKANKEIGRNLFVGGVLLFVAGLAFTAGTYSGFFDLGRSYLIMYGPIFGGLIIAGTGLAQMKR